MMLRLVVSFFGLFQNSMLLGPVSAVSSCYSFWAYYNTKSKWWIVLFCFVYWGLYVFVVSFCCIWCRGRMYEHNAICQSRNRKKIRQMLVVGIVACATFPLWQGALTE